MTEPISLASNVPAIQADREQAAVLLCTLFADCPEIDEIKAVACDILQGKCDGDAEVQAFARHRIAHTPDPAGLREALEAATAQLNERAILIVELMRMVPTVKSRAGKAIVQRCRRVIDGLPDAIREGEANYQAWMKAELEGPEGTDEALLVCARMLDEYVVKELPANAGGQVDMVRAMAESTIAEIRANVSARTALSSACADLSENDRG